MTVCHGFQIVWQLFPCADVFPTRLLVSVGLSHTRPCLPIDNCWINFWGWNFLAICLWIRSNVFNYSCNSDSPVLPATPGPGHLQRRSGGDTDAHPQNGGCECSGRRCSGFARSALWTCSVWWKSKVFGESSGLLLRILFLSPENEMYRVRREINDTEIQLSKY